MTDEEPVSWRSIVYDTPVVSRDGVRVGSVAEVLGSDAEDIFHGLRVSLERAKRDVMLPAADVTRLSASEIGTDLTTVELDALPAYDEEGTYHLASVGWLRKHVGWVRDSKSDEEPG